MDWFCCDGWNWKPWPLPADIGVKPVFFCPFKPSLGSQDTDVRPIWVSLEMLTEPITNLWSVSPTNGNFRVFVSVCFFMCNAFRRWATEKCFFCSPLGLGFGPFNFPQFPTKVHHFRLHMGKWETKQSWGSIFQLPVNFFHNFIPDGPRLTKSLHLRGFPSSLRLLLAMLSRFRLLLVVIIKSPDSWWNLDFKVSTSTFSGCNLHVLQRSIWKRCG
jgi:hypothetical protein